MQIKPYAHSTTGVANHQVYVGNQVFHVMADGKKEARKIIESYGHKVSFVTRFI